LTAVVLIGDLAGQITGLLEGVALTATSKFWGRRVMCVEWVSWYFRTAISAEQCVLPKQ